MYFGAVPASAGTVDITVGVYHTRPDGSDAQLITSNSTTIDSATLSPLAFDLGSGAAETFTQSDPRRLRVTIDVVGITLSESFTLNFDSAVDESRLETPSLTVFDPAIVLAFVAVFIPIVTLMVTQRRKLASRVVSLALALIIALALLSSQVQVVTAAPDAFYLHANVLNDGEDMSTTTGAGPTQSTTFNTLFQTERWYTTLSYPVGGGDDSTLDAGNYTFNMYFQQLPGGGWWDTNYGFRQQITVSTGTEAVTAGYGASLSFNHYSLVQAGTAHFSGDDVRVVHYDGITYTELDRVLDPYTNWNDSLGDSKIWFSLLNPIGASSSDNQYWLYYGYPLAPLPPAAMENVFQVGDNFNDGTLVVDLAASTSGAGFIYESGGVAVIDAGNVATDAAILVDENTIPFDRKFAIRNIINLEAGTGEGVLFGIAEDAFDPTVTDAATEDARRRIMVTHDATSQLVYITYVDSADTTWYWNGTSWVSTPGTSYTTWALDDFHAIEMYGDGTDWWFEIKDLSGTLVEKTGDISWSSVKDIGGDFWYYWGEPKTDQEWIDFISSDWLDIRQYVNPEPTSALGFQEMPPSVDIDVFVYHTRVDGSDPQPIINNSTTIAPSTANPFIFNLGSTVSPTNFSSSDPRRLMVQVTVDDINGSGDFILDYDSPTALSRLETPSLTVLDPALVLAVAAIFIPIITALVTERRRMATRLISVVIALMLALALLSSQVGVVSAAPGSIYFYDTSKVGPTPAGETMASSIGSSAASLTFDTASQNAYWYTDLSYPTGGDDASILAGDYLLEMYFDSLPNWWDTNYAYRQPITVTAGTAAVPSGYSVSVAFDHASLTPAKSLTSGDDVRVVYWNGSGWVELDRFKDSLTSWDTATTAVWFRTQAAISASGSDNNYYLYYGNSSAGAPPMDRAQIFDMFDTFQDLANWSTWQDDGDRTPQTVGATASGGTLTLDPGGGLLAGVQHNTYSPGNTYGFASHTYARSLSVVTDDLAPACWFINAPAGETYCYQTRGSAARNRYVRKHDSAQPVGSDTNIQTETTTGPFPSANTWYTYEVQRLTDGTMRAFRNGSQQFPLSGWSIADTAISTGGFGLGGEGAAGQTYEFDWVWVRKLVDPEPSAAPASEEGIPSVDITVSVHNTKTDGTIPQLITSASTTIDPDTTDGLILNLGAGAAQTYTQADPQLLRVHITVDAINNGGSFSLAYDSATDPTNLETPSLTVLDPVLLLALLAILIPVLTALITQKRRLATRLASILIGIIMAMALVSTQVGVVSAAPDSFYLHDVALNDGKNANNTVGSGAATLAFDTTGQAQHWYTDLTYPTGGDDATVAAGAYTLNMYFNELPRPWWDSNYGYRQRITITAGSATVPSGYTISETINHAQLVLDGKSLASGNDVRVVRWNGVGWTEIDRVLDPASSWDSASTTISFATQAAISSASSDQTYFIYYGNALAGSPPASTANVYDFWDDFNDNDITDWTGFAENRDTPPASACNPGGFPSVSVTGGVVSIDPPEDWCSAGIRHNTFSVSNVEGFALRTRSQLTDAGGSYDDQLPGMWYVQLDASDYLNQAYSSSSVNAGSTSDNRIRELQKADPPTTNVAVGVLDPPVPNTWYDYESFILPSGNMRWERDSVQKSPAAGWANDITYTSGGIGLGSDRVLVEYDWVLVRKLVDPEPTTALASEATAARVRIQVSVYHTDADGTTPTEIITSSTVDITNTTANPYALAIGSGAAQTFTSADPQKLRARVQVIEAIDEQFVLDYDSAVDPSSLETPSLTVPDVTLLFVAVVVLFPILTMILTKRRRRRMAMRLISIVVALLLALALLSKDVIPAVAAPDAFYLHPDPLNGGEMMNITAGTGASTKVFDTAAQTADWFTELNYPTGQDDATVAAGAYALNMYFSSLPDASSWWNTAYDFKQNVTVTAGSAAVPTAYTVSVTFDHAALVSAGKSQADGDDIRITFWNGSGWVELDRFLDPGSSWNDANTRIWFQTQAAILASGSDANYDMYYGNPSAVNPPVNTANIFYFYDGFESGSTSAWFGEVEGVGDTFSVTATQVFNGSWAGEATVDNGTQAAAENRFTAQNALHTTVWVYLPTGYSASTDLSVVQYYGGIWGTQQGSLSIEGTTRIPFIWNNVAGQGYFSDTALSLDTWHRLEMKIEINTDGACPTTCNGRAELWVDGVQKVNESGRNTGSTAFEQNLVGIFWKSSGAETIHVDDSFDRIWVDPEPTLAFAAEEREPSVDVTVSVYHTKSDGSVPIEIITSASTTIDSTTADPFALSIGSGSAQTFTQSDPQKLRVRVTVDSVNNGGSFTLAYDSGTELSNLETPSLVVPDFTLAFVVLAIFIPILTWVLTERRRRRMAMRLMSVIIAVVVALSVASQDVITAVAAPDAFYLHTNPLNGGEDMNITAGTGAATKLFDTASQTADWFTELTYPTGADDATIAAGAYTLNMYFSTLPSAAGWWNTAYGYR
ncbi:MAG: hypothetical protein ACE5M4_06235, partial [Anaerolineales bacterium]